MNQVEAALIQMRSGTDPAANINRATGLIREAAAAGADLVVTPETTVLVQKDFQKALEHLNDEADEPALDVFAALADELGITLVIGSMAIKLPDGKAANRCFVFGPDGAILARYDKVHMFDVGLGPGEHYAESASYRPGDRLAMADTVTGRIGLSICYDLRFAALYRRLAQAGASILTVPAAFTRPTGRAHWEVLLRARAIETGSYVLAPAQGGLHEDGRRTWGRSMVIGPWGEVVACKDDDEPGILTARLDMRKVEECRRRIPALQHDREVAGPGE